MFWIIVGFALPPHSPFSSGFTSQWPCLRVHQDMGQEFCQLMCHEHEGATKRQGGSPLCKKSLEACHHLKHDHRMPIVRLLQVVKSKQTLHTHSKLCCSVLQYGGLTEGLMHARQGLHHPCGAVPPPLQQCFKYVGSFSV